MAENQSSTANMSKETASTQPLSKKSSERAGYREVEREMEAALAEAHAAGDWAEGAPNEPITPPPPAQPSSSQTVKSEGAAHGGGGEEGGDRAALREGGEEGGDGVGGGEEGGDGVGGGEEGGDGMGGGEEGGDDEAWPPQSLKATAEENSGVWVTQSFKLQSTK